MLTENLTLNLTTVQTLIRWRQAEPHPILATAPAWHDEDSKGALDRHALGELEQNRRLRRGRTDEDLDGTIDALVRPDREYYGWVTTTVDGRPFQYGVLAVALRREAVLVVRNHETGAVLLATCRPAELFGRFLGVLPAVAPASAPRVSTPYEDFVAATEPGGDAFTGFGTLRSPEVRAINAVLGEQRTGGGSLYVAGRASGHGPRRRCRQPVNYLDTAAGRWLIQLDNTANGMVATLCPAGLELITAQLTDTERRLSRVG
jgi:hypothetical protein